MVVSMMGILQNQVGYNTRTSKRNVVNITHRKMADKPAQSATNVVKKGRKPRNLPRLLGVFSRIRRLALLSELQGLVVQVSVRQEALVAPVAVAAETRLVLLEAAQ